MFRFCVFFVLLVTCTAFVAAAENDPKPLLPNGNLETDGPGRVLVRATASQTKARL